MGKAEFLERLEQLLSDIPEEERREALEFYRNYFEDAGEGREAEVIRELESPEKVAAQIKAGFRGDTDNGEYGNAGYGDSGFREAGKPSLYSRRKRGMSGWKVFGIICLCIFAIPIGIPMLGALFGLIVAVLAVVFSLGLCVAVVMAVFFIIGIVFLVVGIPELFLMPAVGLMFSGSGMVSLALGFLTLLAVVWVIGTGIPAVCRLICSIWRKIFHRKGEKSL